MSDGPEPLRDTIARHGLQASKALGQNFILDRQLLTKIAGVAGDIDEKTVYEVGPGPGGLTRALLERGAHVFAVERDRRFRPALEELAAEHPGRLELVESDALKIDEAGLAGRGAHVVSNLPYNVGTALLTRWLTDRWPPWWASLTLMFQKEVAERIVAMPGTGAYGRLSVLAQWRSAAKIAMNLSRSAFVPPPKVSSAVVRIVPGEQPAGVDPARIEQLTQAAFGQRRKMLRSSLKSVPGAVAALETIGIDPVRRAETLEVGDFVALARALGCR